MKNGIIFMKKESLFLLLVILFALFLRLLGINYQVPHPDDYSTILGAMHFGLTKIEPTGYGIYSLYCWPAFTMVYLQIVFFTLYFAVGWIAGVFPSMEAFRQLYLTDPSSFYLIGRLMSVAFGAGTVWLLYYFGKKLYNEKTGLIASLFLSVSFIHSFHSQFVRPDIPATFFIMATIMSCFMISEKGDFKYYLYAGLFTCLSIATKYTSGIVVFLIVLAHIMIENKKILDDRIISRKNQIQFYILIILGIALIAGSLVCHSLNLFEMILSRILTGIKNVPENISLLKKLITLCGCTGGVLVLAGLLLQRIKILRNVALNIVGSRKLVAGLIVAVLGFAVFDPLFFLDLENQVRVFIHDANFMGKYSPFIGVDSFGFIGNLWWYIKGPVSWGAGKFIALLGLLGFAYALKERRKKDILFMVTPVLYILSISAGKFRWERYVITLMPFISVYAAGFLYKIITSGFGKSLTVRGKNIALAGATLSIIILPSYNIIRYDYLLMQKDTRVSAKEWVEENIPYGSIIAQDAYTGDLSDAKYEITRKISLSNEPIDFYVNHGFQFLIVSDTQYNRYFAEPVKYEKNVEFYNTIFNKCVLIKAFTPDPEFWPAPNVRFKKYHIHISPTIRIYRISR